MNGNRPTLPESTFALRGPGRFAVAACILVAWSGASAQPEATAPIAPVAADTASGVEAGPDSPLVQLDAHLRQLLGRTLPESVEVGGLFGVRLDDPAGVAARIAELEAQAAATAASIEQLHTRLAESSDAPPEPEAPPETTAPPTAVDESDGAASPARDGATAAENAARLAAESAGRRDAARAAEISDLQAELAAARLRLGIQRNRLAYLVALQERLSSLTDASRRTLPSLGEARQGLRQRADRIAELGGAVDDLATRFDRLAQRSEAGMLVGFVSSQRSVARDFANAAEAYRTQSARLASLAEAHVELAASAERQGGALRADFFRSVPGSGDWPGVDRLFLDHLKRQRALRKRTGDSLTAAGLARIEALLASAASMAARPNSVGTTEDGQAILDTAIEHRQALDSLVAGERAAMDAWSLAFQAELVTVLSDLASPEAHANAYSLTSELLDDVSSELRLARSRFGEGAAAAFTALRSPREALGTPEGMRTLTRTAWILLVLAGWALVRRQAARITVTLVRGLARLRALRGRVGLLVRWSGLVQASLPPLAALAALRLALLGLPDGSMQQLARAVLLPLLLYWLGHGLLEGATRRLARGRPALIELAPATLARLERTYATLGLFVAAAWALDGVARIAIGAGRVVDLLDRGILVWVGVWALFETMRWRVPLAQQCAGIAGDQPPGLERRVADWMGTHWIGFVLSPAALLRVAGTPILEWIRRLARETNLVKSLRAWSLRRRSAPGTDAGVTGNGALPDDYLQAFPLHPILGEDDSMLVNRDDLVSDVLEQLARWRESKTDGSLVILGEKGMGKTTLAAQVGRRPRDIEVVHAIVTGKPTTRAQLVELLAGALGATPTSDLDELAAALAAGPERVVLLDEAHNVFLRRVDGYGAYDALVELVNATSGTIFWVLVFNSFTWRFLNESRGRVHYFRKLLQIPPWTADELQALVKTRNRETGFDLIFDAVLLSDERSADNLQLVEEAEGFFRLLWESSGGNPRIATRLWLSSLTPVSEGALRVGIFSQPSSSALSSLPDDLLFSLAAICQHENLNAAELARVLNVSEGFGRFAIQFLTEAGFLEAKDGPGERSTLAPTYYRAVLRALRSKHLLFE